MRHPLTKWRQEFLERRGHSQPTGQPLYSYRTTLTEFEELERMLKEMMSECLPVAPLGLIARKMPFFPSLFVIYAAEWWRRQYDGSGWSWEPIVESLGAPTDGWNQAQRSECVETGLREWRLRLSDIHGFRFLGSVAFQGGLPMQLLAAARGNIGHVLGRVLRLASTGSVDANDVQEWIRSLSGYLPNAYRQNEIFVLLADVILTVLRLKQEAHLTSATGAIEALNLFDLEWRGRFPVPVEDIQAQGLIEQLIRDAAATRLVRRSRQIAIERRLELLEEGVWQIRSDVDLAEYIDAAELTSWFAADKASLARWLTLRFVRGDRSVEVGLRRLAGRDRYRIERRPLECPIPGALAEHTMTLASSEGPTWNSAVTRGEALHPELPWVFEPIGDATQSFQFVRQGSGSVGSAEVHLSIPANWVIQKEQDCEVSCVGDLISRDRKVWRIKGNVRLTDPDGRHFRIRCSQADAREEQLEWRGTRLWEMSSRPELAFRGIPTLHRISEEGVAHAAGPVGWNIPGGINTRKPAGLVGPVDAVWPAEGEIKWRSRLLVLPVQARLHIEPGENPGQGGIRFSNWGLATAQVDQGDVSAQPRREGADLLLVMEYRGAGSPPEWCDLRLYWTGNPNEGRVRVPFPAKGARAFDAEGRIIADGRLFTVRNILGTRLVGFLGNTNRATLELRLHGGHQQSAFGSLKKLISTSQGETRVEVRLIDYEQDIQRLLSGADALDAVVDVQLQVGFGAATWLRIARYACELEKLPSMSGVRLPEHLQLSVGQLENLPVRAIRIDAPGEEPVPLPFRGAQDGAAAGWEFPAENLGSGPWLIYPGADSNLAFRPLLWPCQSDAPELEAPAGRLAQALRIIDESERNNQLDSSIADLAIHFLDDDWRLIEQLAGQLGHLPLSTLDLWRRFIHSSAGMASLAVRLATCWPPGFLERFSTELPFMWETVPIRIWGQAMWALKDQCEAWYGPDAGKAVLLSHLDRRVQDLAAATPSLRIVLEVTKVAVTGEDNPQIRVARQGFMANKFAEQLFEGVDCRLQHLLRNNSESMWPGGFALQLNQARQDRRAPYLCTKRYDFRDAAINVPIMLALEAVMDLPSDRPIVSGGDVRALRVFQAFDPEWFAEAFDLTVGRCLATNAIHFQ